MGHAHAVGAHHHAAAASRSRDVDGDLRDVHGVHDRGAHGVAGILGLGQVDDLTALGGRSSRHAGHGGSVGALVSHTLHGVAEVTGRGTHARLAAVLDGLGVGSIAALAANGLAQTGHRITVGAEAGEVGSVDAVNDAVLEMGLE